MKDGFAAVKAALESTYACLGITCADVGAYQSSMGVFAGAEACDGDEHPPCQDLMCSGQRCICGRFGCDMDECCLEDNDGNNRGCCNPSFCDDGGADVRGQTIQCNDDHSGWTTCRVPQDSGEAFPEYFEDEDEAGSGCSHGWPAYPGDHPYDVFTDSGKCGRMQDWAVDWALNEAVGTVADIAECWNRCQDLNGDGRTSYCACLLYTSPSPRDRG